MDSANVRTRRISKIIGETGMKIDIARRESPLKNVPKFAFPEGESNSRRSIDATVHASRKTVSRKFALVMIVLSRVEVDFFRNSIISYVPGIRSSHTSNCTADSTLC